MNPLSMMLGNSGGNNNLMQLASQFGDFAKNFKGDPQERINQMLSSGQVTKQQLDQATQTAKMLEPLVSKFMR